MVDIYRDLRFKMMGLLTSLRTSLMNISKCTSEWELNANIRVVYVEKYFGSFSRSKLINAMCIKLVVVPSEKPVPQRPGQNEQGLRVRYGLLYIIVKQITEIFLIFYRGPNIVRPEPESVFARKPG